MKKYLSFMAAMLIAAAAEAKTLVVYYSYTGNCREIVSSLTEQIEADVLEIQPAEKGLKYEANNYALGTQLLNAIKANPNDASSYPAIDPVSVSLDDYQNIIIVTPLWWSQMAAIMQTYLFNYGTQMAGKHVGLIVSSHSSGISGVVADAQRLVLNAVWMGDALWINNSNRSSRTSLIESWLATLDFAVEPQKMYLTIDGRTETATLVDNSATQELVAALQNGPITVTLNDNHFEIWGSLGRSLTTSNEQVSAQPGDIVLYSGQYICIFYGSNSYSYTRLGHIDGLTESELYTFLKAGQNNVKVKLSLVPSITLYEETDNSTVLENNNNKTCDVTLIRTLQTGGWNTFSVPFVLTNLTGTPLEGAKIKKLRTTSVTEGTLTLNFEDATIIESGKPYLVKVLSTISNPESENVVISNTIYTTETTYADFIPTTGKSTIGSVGDNEKSVIFVGAANRLYNPEILPADMKGFRAYFQIKEGSAANIRAFSMIIDDEEDVTGITGLSIDSMGTKNGAWYTFDGRKLNTEHTPKGIYIVNGKKQIKN